MKHLRNIAKRNQKENPSRNKLKEPENELEANHIKMQQEINRKNKEIKQKTNLLERIFSNTHILIAYLDELIPYKR